MLSAPSPSSFFPLIWASRLSLPFFFHALQQAIFPSSPTWLPGGKDWKAKQKNYSLGNYNWHNPAAPKLLLKVREQQKPLPCRDQDKPEEGKEGFEAKAETFDGSRNAVREAPGGPSSALPQSWLPPWQNRLLLHSAAPRALTVNSSRLKISPGSAGGTICPCDISTDPVTAGNMCGWRV